MGATNLNFYGADGLLYTVQGPLSLNGPLPVTPIATPGQFQLMDLEQIKGQPVVTGGGNGILSVGGPQAVFAASTQNPVIIGYLGPNNTVTAAVSADTISIDNYSGRSLGAGANWLFNNTGGWDKQRCLSGATTAGTGVAATHQTPTSLAAVAIAPSRTTAPAGGINLKASAGNVYELDVIDTAGNYVMLFDGAVPADGAVTPLMCWKTDASGTFSKSFPTPIRCNTQISVVSSTTGPFTKTASATAFIGGLVV